jgi:hypothetical protein
MTILLSILKNYAGYFLIVVVAGGWFVYHDHQEIQKGEARMAALQKAADLKEAKHIALVEANAKSTIDDLQARLSKSLATPPQPAVVVRMCRNTASVPEAGAGADRPAVGSGDGTAGSSQAVGGTDQEAPDIAPGTEHILNDDKAIIEYLQGYIRTCQAAGVCRK